MTAWLDGLSPEAELTADFSGTASRYLHTLDAVPEDDWDDEWECGCECCTRTRTLREEFESSKRADALAGIDLDHYWHRRNVSLSTAEWCRIWRQADRRPELVGPVTLYRGGGTAHSMSWTDNPGVALAFANHHYATTSEYLDVIGPVRLPLWVHTFPPEAVLAVIDVEHEYVIDVECFDPSGAERYEPTETDIAAYREFRAPLLPSPEVV